jgi:RNA polymerase sigma factor (sigma-70 family)
MERGSTGRLSDGEDPLIRYYLHELSMPLLTSVEEQELSKRIQAGREAEQLALDGLKQVLGTKVMDLADVAPEEWPPDLADLPERVQDGYEARQHMIQANLRLVVSIAKRYRGTELSLLDLIQEGSFGLMRAVEKFDGDKGFRFSTYATWWIRQSIGRGIADKGRAIRWPGHLVTTTNKIYSARMRLEDTLPDSEITPAAIAEEAGVSEGDVLGYENDLPWVHMSLNAQVSSHDDTEFGDTLASSAVEENGLDKEALKELVAGLLEQLNEREREVIKLRFGLGGSEPLTLKQVGARFNLTRERIRQIEAKALGKLRLCDVGAEDRLLF